MPKPLLFLPLLLIASAGCARDAVVSPPAARPTSSRPEVTLSGPFTIQHVGKLAGKHSDLPVASVDVSSLPVFRGTLPGQPHKVFHLVLSQWFTNCYVLVGNTNKAIVIDPADCLIPLPEGHWDVGGRDCPGHDIRTLMDLLRKNHLDVKYILSTHGHLDHVSGDGALVKRYHCAICMDSADIDADGRPKDSHMFPGGLPKVDRALHDGDTVECDGIVLKVMHTPGHSPGSMSLLCGDWVFSGDTLFFHTVGRTNFHDGSGSWPLELNSIRTRLYTLPDATLVLPGHDQFTTIGEEKANNPWTVEQPAVQ